MIYKWLKQSITSFTTWHPPLYFFVILILLSLPSFLLFLNYRTCFFREYRLLDTSAAKASAHGQYSYYIESDRNISKKTKLFENGKPLPFPDSIHDDIGRMGKGRYSVWGNTIYFSSSDNSIPRTNGKEYKILTNINVPQRVNKLFQCLTIISILLFLAKINSLARISRHPLAEKFMRLRPGILYFAVLFVLMLPFILIFLNDRASFVNELRIFNRNEIYPSSGHGIHAYAVNVCEGKPASDAVLMENGKNLPLSNSMHADIGKMGKGRYSVWGSTVYFSSSDNTDPRSNGKEYKILVPRAFSQYTRLLFTLLFISSAILFAVKVNYFLRYLPYEIINRHPLAIITLLSILLHIVLVFSTPLILVVDTDSYLGGIISALEGGPLKVHICRGPGLGFLYAPVFFIFKSYSLWPLKIFIHALAVGCNIMTYLLALQLTGKKKLAFICGLLAIIWLDGALYSSWVSSEIPTALIILTYTFFLIKALKENKIRDYYFAVLSVAGATLIRPENLLLIVSFLLFALTIPLLSFLKNRDVRALRLICHIIIASLLSSLPLFVWASYNFYRAGFFGLTSYGMVSLHDSALVSGNTLRQNFEADGSPAVELIKQSVIKYNEYRKATGQDSVPDAFYNTWHDAAALRMYFSNSSPPPENENREAEFSGKIDKVLFRATIDSILRNPDRYIAMQFLKAFRIYMNVWTAYITNFAPKQSYEAWIPPFYRNEKSAYMKYFQFDTDKVSPLMKRIFNLYYSFRELYGTVIFFIFLIAIPGFLVCFFNKPLLIWWAFLTVTFIKTLFTILIGFPSTRIIFQGSYLNIILGVCTIWITAIAVSAGIRKLRADGNIIKLLTQENR